MKRCRLARMIRVRLGLLFGMALCGWAVLAGAEDTGRRRARPRAWSTQTLKRQSEARVRISGGWFELGSDAAELERARALCGDCAAATFAPEQPAHRVFVRPFAIDRLEVSNAAYQRCVSEGRCYPPRTAAMELAPELPVVQVRFRDARDYCHFVGGELPSEAQWEYAARGSSRRSFPWGESWNPRLIHEAGGAAGLAPVTSNPDGKSFFGLLNMAGNVWEFVLDYYRAPYDDALPDVDPVALTPRHGSGERVLRGGSFQSPPHTLRARYRASIRADDARADVGLRCVYEAR
jgi:formylglycine-generating enzyme required for sulfatase activity